MSRATRTLVLLVAVVVAGAGVWGLDAARGPSEEGPSLLLITVDTLRTDHLGVYGHRLETSPTIDALAARGVRFADASVQWPKTWPSMASMLTGNLPAETGMPYRPRRALPQRNRMLAEILRDAGYRTGAVVANVNLGREFAFDQGFDVFVESWEKQFRRRFGDRPFDNRPGRVKEFTNATLVTDQGLRFLERVEDGEPFFLWVHYMDPHGPYVPPPAYGELFQGEYPSQKVPVAKIPPYQRQRHPVTNRVIADLAHYRAQYDREIRYLDDELGRLLEVVRKREDGEDTLVVFTSDHGESFHEHGYYLEHGANPFEPGVSAPLILVHPTLPAGRVVEIPVALVDLLPTVLDVLGLETPEAVTGRSLMPRIRGSEPSAPPYVFLEAGHRLPSQLAVRRGRWKLVQLRSEADRQRYGPEWQLFDLAADPGEERNVLEEHPEVAEELRAAVEAYAAGAPEAGGETLDLESLDEDTVRMLEALGYVE